MFGIGGFELFLILLFGFLIFGPDKLPEIAKTVGKAIAKFRNAQNEMSDVFKGEVFDKDSDTPFKNPFDAIDNATAKAQKASESASKAADQVAQKAESFSERKARYDRERAERRAAEKAAAEEAAAATAATAATTAAAAAVAATAAPAEAKPSAAELYGTKPAAAPATEAEPTTEKGE